MNLKRCLNLKIKTQRSPQPYSILDLIQNFDNPLQQDNLLGYLKMWQNVDSKDSTLVTNKVFDCLTVENTNIHMVLQICQLFIDQVELKLDPQAN